MLTAREPQVRVPLVPRSGWSSAHHDECGCVGYYDCDDPPAPVALGACAGAARPPVAGAARAGARPGGVVAGPDASRRAWRAAGADAGAPSRARLRRHDRRRWCSTRSRGRHDRQARHLPGLPQLTTTRTRALSPSLSNSTRSRARREKSLPNAWAMHPEVRRRLARALESTSTTARSFRAPARAAWHHGRRGANDWRTKAAQAERDEARAAWRTPSWPRPSSAAKKAAGAFEAELANPRRRLRRRERGHARVAGARGRRADLVPGSAGPTSTADHLPKTTGIAETRAIERLIVNMDLTCSARRTSAG